MKWTLVVFLTAVAAAAVYGQSSVSSPPITPKVETTTLTTDPTTSPPVTTTTDVTSTSQTTPAETTTAAPTTTTPSPETTTAPPATTTEAPVTTSQPTTTSKPPGDWVLYYPDTSEPCIIVSMTMKFKIHDHENKVVEVPKHATVSGSCDVVTTLSEPSDQQHLQLSFNTTDGSYSVDMLFEADEESKGSEKLVIKVKEWKLNYELTNKTEISSSVVEPVLRFGGNMTYHCDYNRKFKMTYEDSLEASYIDIQAFVTKDANLGTESCEEDKTNDIVPIAVGCALAALVIIVLIAYLIGRRRSRQKGYQSV